MSPAWMFYTLILSALIGLAATAGERAARTLGLPTRLSWCAGLIAVCLASAWSSQAPAREQPLRDFPLVGASSAPSVGTDLVAPATSVVSTPLPIIPVNRLLAWAWVVMSVAAGLFFVAMSYRLRRARREWTPTREANDDIMISDDIGPAVVGFFRPVIVMPAWAMRESDDRRRLLIAHERQHLKAGDQRVLALSFVVAVALPWNVIVWWMIARLRHAIEIDCDARVIRWQPGIRAYAELLIDVSSRPAQRSLGLTGFSESPSNLERRLMALTTHMPRRSKATITRLAATMGFAVLIACEIPRPAGPASHASNVMQTVARGATEMPAPLPRGAASSIERVLARSFPAVNESGTENGRPLWLIADRQGNVVASWIGAPYTETELRRVALQPAYDSMQLVVFHASTKSRRGSPIQIVWAADQKPWESHEYLSERTSSMIRDSLRILQPAMYAALPEGQAVYFYLDWQSRRVGKIWAGPALSDAKAQWDYAQSHFSDRAVLIATSMSVTTDDDRRIPVVNLYRQPWSMRYGSR